MENLNPIRRRSSNIFNFFFVKCLFDRISLFFQVDDVQLAKKYGLFALPAIVHYEDGIPNVYDEDMTAAEVFSWLEDQKTGSYIEKVKHL